MTPRANGAGRTARLRAPLLLSLWALLALETAGGLVLFVAELAWGRRPGESLHVLAGVMTTAAYAAYQWGHWRRVAPLRPRLDYVLGVLASATLALTLITGLALGAFWWRDRVGSPRAGEVRYPAALSAFHNIGSMLVMAFVGAHLGAVLMRDRTKS